MTITTGNAFDPLPAVLLVSYIGVPLTVTACFKNSLLNLLCHFWKLGETQLEERSAMCCVCKGSLRGLI